MLEDYIRDNAVSWFEWSKKIGLGIERMEDLILVSGCTLVTTWGAAAFVDNAREAEISLATTPFPNGGGSFYWNKAWTHGTVLYHNGRSTPVRFPGCVYSPCPDSSSVVSKG